MPKGKGYGKKKPGSAARRTYKSMTPESKQAIKSAAGITGKATKKQRTAIGKSVRKSRLKGGRNPNTGSSKVTAKQLGLRGVAKKAYQSSSSSTKGAIRKVAAGSSLKRTGAKYNTLTGVKGKGPTKKTQTVARIAKRKGISRAAANRVRKSRKG